ncbi:MAG: SdrD B-like domain-containing protein [Anaerolineaceae bacterium]|nr:SdrD B-like domain-containing protein [Anaerolineaceae bacterium]
MKLLRKKSFLYVLVLTPLLISLFAGVVHTVHAADRKSLAGPQTGKTHSIIASLATGVYSVEKIVAPVGYQTGDTFQLCLEGKQAGAKIAQPAGGYAEKKVCQPVNNLVCDANGVCTTNTTVSWKLILYSFAPDEPGLPFELTEIITSSDGTTDASSNWVTTGLGTKYFKSESTYDDLHDTVTNTSTFTPTMMATHTPELPTQTSTAEQPSNTPELPTQTPTLEQPTNTPQESTSTVPQQPTDPVQPTNTPEDPSPTLPQQPTDPVQPTNTPVPLPTYKIGNYVWLDENKDGIQDIAEMGVKDVEAKLYDYSGNLVWTTTTDDSGFYIFTNLLNGEYTVTFTLPSGYVETFKNQGDPTADSNGLSSKVVLNNADDMTIDLGLVLGFSTPTSTLTPMPHTETPIPEPSNTPTVTPEPVWNLGDYVWFDANHDGMQNLTENPVIGVKVELYDSENSLIKTTYTNNLGYYTFSDLANGSYTVKFYAPAGYDITFTNIGAADKDSDGLEVPVTMENADNLTIDLGLVYSPTATPTWKLGDFVWEDLNKNGIQDSDEPGIAGVEVVLKNAKNEQIDSTLTDEKGHYQFEGLVNGEYTVVFIKPEGFGLTTTNAGTDLTLDSNGLESKVLIQNANDWTVDLGIISHPQGQPTITVTPTPTVTSTNTSTPVTPTSTSHPTWSLGDFVWEDLNKNGVQDSGEPGIANVEVMLKNAEGVELARIYTDGSGRYKFTGLFDGTYTVIFMMPSGFDLTATNAGGDSARDSNGIETKVVIEGADNWTIDLGVISHPQAQPTIKVTATATLTPTTQAKIVTIPYTGDNGNMLYYAMLMIISLVLAVLLFSANRRPSNLKKEEK